MGKLVVSLDGVVIKEVQIIKDKTTLGRRPYNDIVIDNLAVSGEHAVLQMVGQDVFIEDLNSTNGTYINGKAVKKQLLAHNDTVERNHQLAHACPLFSPLPAAAVCSASYRCSYSNATDAASAPERPPAPISDRKPNQNLVARTLCSPMP